ncbi:ABC transporter ATP-binding protein [Paenibacillus ginsengarvi]|uniref:ABC transporter ATP-binding protein n=1 Tax=Paenibacillus ginsengarvi TaxID=400777 RepID=A0A3B0CFU2_9BACL|nr:ABC transporter ATP-binding protein [Paenibacillus ginsengarvi]RKN84775.1 ABC transporter ATP-binding protein [Paenibacillus ginsengarvi]
MPQSPIRSKTGFAIHRLTPFKGRIALLFLLLLTGIALQIYSPRYVQLFIDQAKQGSELSVLTTSALLFLLLTSIRQVVTVAVQAMTGELTWNVTNRLRLELAGLCLERDSNFHSRHTPGELLERIDGDASKLNNFLSAFILKVIGNHLLIVAAAAAIWFIHPVVGAAVTGLSALALYVLHRMGSYGTSTVRRYLAESAELLGYMEERIAGREDIRALNATSHVLASYYDRLRSLYRTRKRTGAVLGITLNAGEVTLAAVLAGTLLALGLLSLHGADLTIGTIFLVYYYVTMLLVPLRNIVAEMSDLQQAGAALHRVGELLAEGRSAEASPSSENCRLTGEGSLSVRFEQVTFGYEVANPVIRALSFEVPAGRTIGIVGRTGSGKSTIAKLLFRLFETQQGTITIGGDDIRSLDQDSLRSRIAYIPQSTQLFEGTLRDNITMFDPSVSNDELYETMRILHMNVWLEHFPQSLDKLVSRDGQNLSAGEAQLIAFARAFLKRPGIVIMDEASSRIDPATERTIAEAVARLMSGRTVLVIAHKLDTVASMDYMLVMQNGTAAEFGETRQLAQDPSSVYASMLRKAREA